MCAISWSDGLDRKALRFFARAAKPNVGLGVGFFSGQLGNRFARTFGRHIDLDALAFLKRHGDHAAPSRLRRTNDVDLFVLRLGAESHQGQKRNEFE